MTDMKTWKLTFNNFKWLDWRTTLTGSSFSWKPNDVWFEEMYGIIKNGVLHPLPDFEYYSKKADDWRLFECLWTLYFMHSSWIKKRNWSSFVSFISQSFTDAPVYRQIKPFTDITSSWAVTLTRSSNTSSSITVNSTLPLNKYVDKHVVIWTIAWTQCLYITGNDANTIYVDGMINWDIMALSNTIYIYDSEPVLIVNDWSQIYRYSLTGTDLWVIDTVSQWDLIEIFANRLFLMKNNIVYFSTFNSWAIKNTPFNSLTLDGKVVDKKIIENNLVLFTTQWTYSISGTWYTTMNLTKISEFSPQCRVYPVSYNDKIYITYNWYIRRFTLDWLQDTQYNYSVVPSFNQDQDYSSTIMPLPIFSVDRWIVFPLWHWTNKYWIINIQELENRKIITITNYYDYQIKDLIEFDNKKFIVRKAPWWSPITFMTDRDLTYSSLKTNVIRSEKKIYIDDVEYNAVWNYSDHTYLWILMNATIDWTEYGLYLNSYSNRKAYPIRKMAYNTQLYIYDTQPIRSFTINYKY